MNDEQQAIALAKIFHEPNRLAIMSALCTSDDGLSFSELRNTCNLTDGNLNRHLKVLTENEAVCISKAFVDDRPRTTITLTPAGLERFQEYLRALEDVLLKARTALDSAPRRNTVTGMPDPHAVGVRA